MTDERHVERVRGIYLKMREEAGTRHHRLSQAHDTIGERAHAYKVINLVAGWVECQANLVGTFHQSLGDPHFEPHDIISDAEVRTALAVVMWIVSPK